MSEVSSSSNNSTLKSLTRHTGKKIKNAQLAEFPSETEALNKWSIPKVPPKEIYKIGFWDYKSLIAVKTLEKTVTVDDTEQTVKLLTLKDIEPYFDKYQICTDSRTPHFFTDSHSLILY